jgi:putative membrane protein
VIVRYSDHAANERTFLAWVRTGIAVIAFGFVVEKFNLFVRTLALADIAGNGNHPQLKQFSGAFSHYDGLVLIIVGIAIIVVSLVRFIRIGRLLDDEQTHPAGTVRTELTLAIVLALIVTCMTAYFALL